MIIACRNSKRGHEAADQLNNDKRVKDNGKVIYKQLDLASFESIRKFADEINNEEEAIDILVNNAGVMFAKKGQRTNDGFEMHFGVNHLGPFLLTLLLIDKLKQSSSIARIINVSSVVHFLGLIRFDDINMENRYNCLKAYAQSKLANILFTRELAKRLNGTNIRAYSLHPGVVDTNLGHGDSLYNIMRRLTIVWYIPPELGCQTILYCALDDKLANQSGHYYANCTKFQNKNFAMSNYIPNRAVDDVSAEKLWNLSCHLVKLENKYNIQPAKPVNEQSLEYSIPKITKIHKRKIAKVIRRIQGNSKTIL